METTHHPTRIFSPSQYTLSLLKERARLLEELAKYEAAETF